MSRKQKGKRTFVHLPNHGIPHVSTIVLSPMVIRVLPRTDRLLHPVSGSAKYRGSEETLNIIKPGFCDVPCMVTLKLEDAKLLASRSYSQILTKIEVVVTETALTRRGDTSSPSSTQNPVKEDE